MRTRLVQGLAAIALLALVACSGGTTNAGSTTTPSDTTSASTTPSATSSTGGGAGAFSSAECRSAALAMTAAAAGGFGSSGTPTSPQRAVDTLNRIASAAPSAVQSDIRIVAAALHDFYTTIQNAGVDFSNPNTFSSQKAQQAFQKAEADFKKSGADKASQRIRTYFAGVCPGA